MINFREQSSHHTNYKLDKHITRISKMASKLLSGLIHSRNQGATISKILLTGAALTSLNTIKCENPDESLRFESTLSYHRSKREEYENMWQLNEDEILSFKNGTWSSSGEVMIWPTDIPKVRLS